MLYFLSIKRISGEKGMKTVKRTCIVFLLCFVILSAEIITAAAVTYKDKIAELSRDINALVVYDITEGETLFAKNEKQKISVASTTKLMTSLVALRYMSPDYVITVGDEINMRKPNSSIAFIAKGHKLKLRTLIAALLLPSGNDAAYTVAVNVARHHSGNSSMSNADAVTYFCSLMNAYAKELGCKNTSFVNPEGWDNENHYSTAEDMTLIALEATKNVFITSTASIQQKRFTFYSGEWIIWENTNLLLDPSSSYYCEYATGLKTGTTDSAGKCLVATAEKDGRKILVLAYGAKTETDRFQRVKEIIELVLTSPSLPETVFGDVDSDGIVTASDARFVLRASVFLEKLTPEILKLGDIDKSGALTANDARMILRASVGLEQL